MKLAQVFGSKLHIIHIYGALKRADTIISVNKLLKRESDQRLEELIQSLDRPSGINLIYKSVKGTDIPSTVDRVAKQLDIDLIVTGTQGEMSDPDIFLGSITGALIKKTNIPTLLMPNNQILPPINDVLLAIKSVEIDRPEVLEPLRFFLQFFSAGLEIINIQPEGGEPSDALPSQTILDLGEPVRTVEARDIYDGVERYLLDHPVDILCVLRRKRGFFELLFKSDATKKSSFHSNIPMLVLQGDH